MTNILPKNNSPKLKWWQKGALVGLGIAILEIYFLTHFRESFGGDPAGIFGLMFLMELPVLPLFFFLRSFFDHSFKVFFRG